MVIQYLDIGCLVYIVLHELILIYIVLVLFILTKLLFLFSLF
jgi:hypothetical protein